VEKNIKNDFYLNDFPNNDLNNTLKLNAPHTRAGTKLLAGVDIICTVAPRSQNSL
jgi:hypothetical protein